MHRRRGGPPRSVLAAVVALAALRAGPAGADPQAARPTDEALRAIEDRGRFVARYVDAVAKGRAVFSRDGKAMPQPDSAVALESRDGWRVVFLKEAGKGPVPGGPRQGTVILAELDYGPDTGDVSALRSTVPPRAAPSSTVSYARALDVAQKAVDGRASRGERHDAAVFRESDGTFTVYFLSKGDTESDVIFGRDFAARVAVSGRQLVSLDPLHSQTTVVPLAGHPPAQPTLHVHPIDDLPTPTDIALVLLHAAAAPHLIMTPHSIFRVDATGTLTYLGPNQAPPAATSGTPAAPGGSARPGGPAGGS